MEPLKQHDCWSSNPRTGLRLPTGSLARICLAPLLVGSLLLTFLVDSAYSQVEAPVEDPWAGVEEMLVTGTGGFLLGQGETISVLSFDSEDLADLRITDVGSLAEYTPNLEIKTGASSVSSPTLFIRGIGLLDFNSNASSSVAIYNDGMYMNSPLGQLFQFFDLGGVEVLRGPQGTTYARNATAGAIRITPNRPDGEFSFQSQVTYGNYDTIEVDGAMGFPIVPDLLSGRIAARYAVADGYTENRCADNPNAGSCERQALNERNYGPVEGGLDKDLNDTDNWAGRLLLRLQPTDDQDWVLNVSGGQSKAFAYQFQSRGVEGIRNGEGGDGLRYRDNDGDPFAGDYDYIGEEKLDIVNIALNGDIEYDRATLHSTTGYARSTVHAPRNFDASPNQFAHANADSEVWQVTQELSLASIDDARFDWEFGGFFLSEYLDSKTDLLRGIVVFTQEQAFEQQLQTWALFAKGSYEISEQVTLEGGFRYNWERKEFDLNVSIPVSELPGGRNSAAQDDQVWDEPTGEIVLTWSPIETASVYAKYTHGFKGGHFNGGAIFSAQSIEAVNPEVIDAFEVGLKSEWFDGAITLNVAAWYYDYDDYQVFALQNSGGAFPLPQLLNAPRLESRGFELDAVIRPTEELEFGVSIGYIDANFTDFTVQRLKFVQACPPARPPCPPEPEVLKYTGNPLVASPPLSANLSISYAIPLGKVGTLTPRLDASYRDKVYFVPGNSSEFTLGQDQFSKNEGASQAAYWLTNFRVNYLTADTKIGVAFWVQNLTNETYLNNSLSATSGLGTYLDVYGQPRTYGVTGSLRW
jgi:iron complex outermembrane recepter protein